MKLSTVFSTVDISSIAAFAVATAVSAAASIILAAASIYSFASAIALSVSGVTGVSPDASYACLAFRASLYCAANTSYFSAVTPCDSAIADLSAFTFSRYTFASTSADSFVIYPSYSSYAPSVIPAMLSLYSLLFISAYISLRSLSPYTAAYFPSYVSAFSYASFTTANFVLKSSAVAGIKIEFTSESTAARIFSRSYLFISSWTCCG